MPRRARFVVDPGGYHVLSRGNNREYIFKEKEDFKNMLGIIRKYKREKKVKIYHYAVMNNHIHMIIKAGDGEILSETMKGIKLGCARYYRTKYKGIGHLWQERFKNFLIDRGRYLLECGRYIELNPVRAGMVEKPEEYKWSSYSAYAYGKEDGIVDKSPEYFGLPEEERDREKRYIEFIMDGIKERRSASRYFREGVYGSKAFIDEMRKKGLVPVWLHRGRPRKKK